MENHQKTKQRAREMELHGEYRAALELYAGVPEAERDPSLLARMGAVQVRLEQPREAIASFQAAAERLREAGRPNAAIAIYRMLLRHVPSHAEAYLPLAELTADERYLQDAREAYAAYLESAAEDPEAVVQALIRSLSGRSASARARLVPEIRTAILSLDPAAATQLDSLANGSAPAEARVPPVADSGSDAPGGLIPTTWEEPEAPPLTAPIEGLESSGAREWAAHERVPLEELQVGGAREHDEQVGEFPLLEGLDVADTSAEAEPLPMLGGPDVDTGAPRRRENEEEPAPESVPHGEADVLPLLGFEGTSAGGDAAAGEGDADEWVDLGSLVWNDEDEADGRAMDGSAAAPATPPPGGSRDDFTGLLQTIGAPAGPEPEGDPSTSYDLGVAYKEMGLLDAAVGQLVAALRGGAHPLATLEVLGECLLANGEPGNARHVLQRAGGLPADPEELVGVRYWLARCHEELGEQDSAREQYRRVVEVEPEFRDAGSRLAALGVRPAL